MIPPASALRAADVVDLTRALVRIPSVNPQLERDGAGEGAVAYLCAGLLEEWGFAVDRPEVESGRPNVVARLGSGGPVRLLNGHLDTVGVAGMTAPPFEGEVRDGHLHGRGACDMKGGVAALLAAARSFAQAHARSVAEGTLIVALTADEEHASLGMQALTATGPEADWAVVCEPTSLTVMPAHKGFLWLTAHFEGVAAHGSRPDHGIDAIRHAAAFMTELEPLHAKLETAVAHPLLGHGSFHFGRVQGGTAPSVYPDACQVELERRTLPGEGTEVASDFHEALQRARSRMPGMRARLTQDLYRPGSDVPAEAPVVQSLLRALQEEGLSAEVRGMTAWVDAAYLNQAGVPAVCFGPGSIERAHTADESVPVSELVAAQHVLERLLGVRNLQGSPAP